MIQTPNITNNSSSIDNSESDCQRWLAYLNPNVNHRFAGSDRQDLKKVSARVAKANRQNEFESGRRCAEGLLADLGCNATVEVNPDRSPSWPDGFAGSISHSKHLVWAAVASKSSIQSVGIDTENVVTSEARMMLQASIATDEEWAIAESTGLTPEQIFSVVFSAKEAFYKCLYPLKKKFFGFTQAAVDFASNERLRIRMLENNPCYGQEPEFLDVFSSPLQPTCSHSLGWIRSKRS